MCGKRNEATLVGAPEGVSNGRLPSRVGDMSLKADVIASMVLDLVAGRVASNRVPLTSSMAMMSVMLLTVLVLVLVLLLLLLLLVSLLVSLELSLFSLETSLLLLEPLTLLLSLSLSIFPGLLCVVVIIVQLVNQQSSTKGKQPTSDSESGIHSLLLVLQRLGPLQVDIDNSRNTILSILTRSMITRVLSGNIMSGQGEGDLTVLLAVGCVDREDGVEVSTGGMDDLVEGDGGEGNDGIGSVLLVHDLDEEVLLAVKRDIERLVPDRVLAGILVDEGLLEGLGVLEVEGEAEVGVLLAKGL